MTQFNSSTTVFNIDNYNKYYWAENHHIIIISKGSCDTEDWSNDAENYSLKNDANQVKEQSTNAALIVSGK